MLLTTDTGEQEQPVNPNQQQLSRLDKRGIEPSGKKDAEQKPQGSKETKQRRPLRKLLITAGILVILLAAIFGGMVFGYVMLGKQSMDDVLKWSTWKHVYELIFSP